MAKLPTPGGDDGVWGDILNDFLKVAHNDDGTIKLDTDGTLAANSDTKIASQKAIKTYVDNTVSGGAPDADGDTKGIIKLAGDLGGTADSPQIAAGAIVNADINNSANIAQSKIANLTTDLAGKQDALGFTPENSSNKDTDGTLAANSDTKYPSQKAVKTYVDTEIGGAAAPDADADTKGIIQLAGDLSGTADSPQIATGAIVNADINNSANIAQSKIANLTSDLAAKQDADADLTAIAGLSPTNDDILQRKSGAWTNRSMSQLKSDLSLTKTDVGLGNVDNTSDATKNSAEATLTNKTLTSPVINTGVSGTAIDTDGSLAANSDTKLASQKATKSYVDNSVSDLQTAIVADVLANRGTAAAAGDGGLFFATDTEQLYRSNGSDWAAVAAAADGSTRRVGTATAPAEDTTISSATTMSLSGGGLTVSGTTNGGKIRIELEAIILNGTTPPSQLLYIVIKQDGSQIGLKAINPAPLTVTSSGSSPVNSVTVTKQNQNARLVWEIADAPSAGAHSWEAILGSTAAVSSTIIGAGGAPPATLSVYEIAE